MLHANAKMRQLISDTTNRQLYLHGRPQQAYASHQAGLLPSERLP